MFSRRRKPTAPEQPPGPDVYISSEELAMIPGGTIRFFFTEELSADSARLIDESLKTQLMFLKRFDFRPYKNYVALTWVMKDEDDRYFDDVQPEVQLIALGILANHFGWQNPDTGSFQNDTERRELMRRLGVEWTLGKL